MSRPESGGSDYELPDYNRDAWQEFTPWRLGDPSTAGEAPASYAADGALFNGWSRDRGRPAAGRSDQPAQRESADVDRDQPRGRWWTEDQPVRYREGDQVRSTDAVGGTFISHVPGGTRGWVESTRDGLLGGSYATVRFENGYTEEVRTSDLKRDSWW